MTVFLFILLALGVARVTWFITEDHLPLIKRPRDWVVNRKPEGNLAYLVGCWWCVSIYVAAGAAAFAVWVLNVKLGVLTDWKAYRTPLADWKTFLVLWPAFSLSATAIMGAADWLTNRPDR